MAVQVYFVGAGPGDPKLITSKGKEVIERADVVIYADSLIPSEICRFARVDAEIHPSASMSLEQITAIIEDAVKQDKTVARVQSGDPSIYGAIHEQMVALDEKGIGYEVIPGVSSLFAAAAALKTELTIPELSQTVIITRLEGRTPVPSLENLKSLAKHQSTMAIFLSASLIEKVVAALLEGGYPAETPAAAVYKASWEDEMVVRAPLKRLTEQMKELGIKKQALILVGDFLSPEAKGRRSKLYHQEFKHEFR
ncbi:MAG: precorrin-4 C(11)-methyltransferase [Dehalococcoidales bacterium]|jgi:precorrin-4/cobalt-precorrin-4 C11-methyltransferase|nr:precorrin-4 C(11)-methyltransferase [Dehalococcoidales bacterium]|tara:strand:- start:408 stop:1166 length:759 start_codon:yes stop_codon:yes gene_type:complete